MAVLQPMKLDHCPPEHSLEQARGNHKKSLNLLAKWTATSKSANNTSCCYSPSTHSPNTPPQK